MVVYVILIIYIFVATLCIAYMVIAAVYGKA